MFRTGSRFGAARGVDVLTGKATDNVKKRQHDQVSTFGIGTELDDKGWRTLIRRSSPTAPWRWITNATAPSPHRGRAADPARRSGFTMRVDLSPEQSRRRGERAAAADWPEATGEKGAVTNRLRLAASTAKERNVPAYVIFHDATLRDIARRRPTAASSRTGLPSPAWATAGSTPTGGTSSRCWPGPGKGA